MELTLPEVPAGVVTLLALFTPYGTALLNGFTHLTGTWKRLVSVAVSLAVAGISLVIYYSATGHTVPNLVGLLLLAIVVSQSSYALVTKNTAKALEDRIAVGSLTRRAERDPGDDGHMIIPELNADGASIESVGGWIEYPEEVDETAGEAEPEQRGEHRAD